MKLGLESFQFTEDDSIRFENGALYILDQNALPSDLRFLELRTPSEVANAIKRLSVRGAMAIGIAAAFGVLLGAISSHGDTESIIKAVREAVDLIASTRPTARNLFWALEQMQELLDGAWGVDEKTLMEELEERAMRIASVTVETNKKIVEVGQEIIKDGIGIITHCNSGALAALRFGTALSILIEAHKRGKKIHVYVDETRPLLQGARLSSWELERAGVPYTLLTDGMAGMVMREGKINLAITGADRICLNGDAANKVGTYSLAVLARAHGIPFYIAAPLSTVDFSCRCGDEIKIERRDPVEVRSISGLRIAPENAPVYNPAFDITPAEYISGIVTEEGIARPPFEKSLHSLHGS
ncbi:MAG: S-methyl-5-thioribose-1-phosphate isomerase [Actinomycetota bacterium]|nr:S-methyl-5-thioribose-1-phosphate isomerase [Actinomycetota bacterium]